MKILLPVDGSAYTKRMLAWLTTNDCSETVFKPIRKCLAKHDLATRYEAKVGHAPEVIAKTADKGKFDLVVMGSHGHGNLMNLVMGSVATQVLARTKVPVLLIR